MRVTVLRLDHRKERDKRITSHVALAARAFGAAGIVYSGERDPAFEATVADVADRWGGKFPCRHVADPLKYARKFRGDKVHLTFYGMPLSRFVSRKKSGKPLLLIVGGSKVPRPFYDLGSNISVTDQPHSEVAALAVFLHEYLGRKEEALSFPGWKARIVPSEKCKVVQKRDKPGKWGRR